MPRRRRDAARLRPAHRGALAAAKAALAAKASAPAAAAAATDAAPRAAADSDKPCAAQSSSPLPTVEVVADGLAAAGLREKAAFPLACVLVAGAALLGAAVVAFRRPPLRTV